jgi:hypothetical protein
MSWVYLGLVNSKINITGGNISYDLKYFRKIYSLKQKKDF